MSARSISRDASPFERADSYEFGSRLWSEDRGQLSVAYYRMDVDDEIFFDPTSGPFGANINFEKVRHQGLETEFRLAPLPAGSALGLDFFGSYTYTRAVILSDGLVGKKYPVTPAHMGHVGATAQLERTYLTLLGRLVGRRFLINDFTNSSDTLGSYWLADLKLGTQWHSLKPFFLVQNLFDRAYLDSGGTNQRFFPGAERSFLVGFEAEF